MTALTDATTFAIQSWPKISNIQKIIIQESIAMSQHEKNVLNYMGYKFDHDKKNNFKKSENKEQSAIHDKQNRNHDKELHM